MRNRVVFFCFVGLLPVMKIFLSGEFFSNWTIS